jgi:hypothetical protein
MRPLILAEAIVACGGRVRHPWCNDAARMTSHARGTMTTRSMLAAWAAALLFSGAATAAPDWMAASTAAMEAELVARHGAAQRARVARGLAQVGAFWRDEDGGRETFESFVLANFAGDQATVDELFERMETNLEVLYGHLHEINVAFRLQSDLDRGPVRPWDAAFAGWSPTAHVSSDFFATKLAFTVLLNFRLTTLDERMAEGADWSRRDWAEARLAQRFSTRVPADVIQAVSEAGARATAYIADYNIWMHHLLSDDGERLFPPGMKLLTHWNLRDQIRADYSDAERGLERQRMTAKVMSRIVEQTVPAVVVDNPAVDWNPWTNEVSPSPVRDSDRPVGEETVDDDAPEPDTRYAAILGNFRAALALDDYTPAEPTEIARSFERGREIPASRVREMFEQVLTSPLFGQVGALIAQRLGRPLEPFDLWYNGFRAGGAYPQARLDALTRERYPTPAAYEADIPRQLVELGFAPERAAVIAENIIVEPARGSGHAWGAAMRSGKTRLRTRVGADGMDYKGYNIAVHELGHNVEQTLSLNDIDYYSLEGVPNNAFTEALAFVFQARDLELLGLERPDAESQALLVLDDFWSTAEIAGVALMEMDLWRWMYANPDATPAELKAAALDISRDLWNRYFAPVFGLRDVVLLGVYSHMVERNLYLANYPLGGMIARQIEAQVERAGDLGAEFERMARIGRVTPDQWMIEATGAPVGPDALLRATAVALADLGADAPPQAAAR